MLLVNAREVKNVPGRKTDVSDAAWLADLGAHGLLRASFVPPEPIRQLRDLTRARTHITQGRTREIQRLEKLLESAGIKLSSVATDITGVSGRLMLQALIDSQGTADPAVMADLAKRRMRSKIPILPFLSPALSSTRRERSWSSSAWITASGNHQAVYLNWTSQSRKDSEERSSRKPGSNLASVPLLGSTRTCASE